MTKKIVLKLKSVEYSGDSIGDDIRLEIDILGNFFNLEKKIKVRSKKELNKIIGEFNTDAKIFEAHIDLRIIENDPIFNDVGNLKTQIKIDTALNSQEFVYKIEVKESRIHTTKSSATFLITLISEVVSTVRYIEPTDDGWVVGKKLDNTKIDLPAFLKVNFDYQKFKRDYIIIAEGINRDIKASLPIKSSGGSYLIENYPHTELVELTYSKSNKVLSVNGRNFQTTDDNRTPWDKGIYDVEIPDWSHKLGQQYKTKAKYATTWFRIGHVGERYIHTGRISKGCITLTEHKYFDDLYKILITARKGDDKSVGILTVVD